MVRSHAEKTSLQTLTIGVIVGKLAATRQARGQRFTNSTCRIAGWCDPHTIKYVSN